MKTEQPQPRPSTPTSPPATYAWPAASLLGIAAAAVTILFAKASEDVAMRLIAGESGDVFVAMQTGNAGQIALLVVLLVAMQIGFTSVRLTITAWLFRSRLHIIDPPGFAKSINLSVIESVRALAAIMVRVPLLLLPALYEWGRLSIIPYLVLLDSRYRAGDADALTLARTLFKQRWRLISLLLLPPLLVVGAQFLLTASDPEGITVFDSPGTIVLQSIFVGTLQFAVDLFILIQVKKRLFGP